MTVLLSCLFIAVLLSYFSKAPLVVAMKNSTGGYDNCHPREQAASLKGFGARAWAAHQNSFESLLVFAIAILAAVATNHTGRLVQILAVAHIVLRCVYHVVYLLNLATLRTSIWFLGLLCSLIILGVCI